MVAWPAIPTSPQINSLTTIDDENVIRTTNDVGPPIKRRRYTAATTKFSFALVMTKAEVATLRTFYDSTLGSGVTAFTFPNPITGATENFYFSEPYTLTSIEAIDYYLVGLILIKSLN